MLELAIARELYERYPDFSEGRLAKIRSHVVSRASCAVVARELGLGERLAERARRPFRRTSSTRLSRNRNVLAALLEAALGALFLEHGFEQIEKAVVAAFAGRIEYALNDARRPQDRAAGGAGALGQSVVVLRARGRGAAARPHVHCAAVIDGEEAGVGRGPSKKDAEQEAAREALAKLESS